MNIFRQFLNSIYRFDKYNELAQLKGSKVVAYEMVLFFVSLILTVLPIVFLIFNFGGTRGLIKEFVPEFKIESGVLAAENNVFESNGTVVIIDGQNVRDVTELEKFSNGVIFDKEKLIINNGIQTEVYSYSDILSSLGKDKFEKADIFEYVSVINFLGIIFLVVWFVSIVISEALGIFALSVFGICFSHIFKKKIKYLKILKVSIYSRTLAEIIFAIFSLFGFVVPIVFTIILDLAYLFFAIKNVETDEKNEVLE